MLRSKDVKSMSDGQSPVLDAKIKCQMIKPQIVRIRSQIFMFASCFESSMKSLILLVKSLCFMLQTQVKPTFHGRFLPFLLPFRSHLAVHVAVLLSVHVATNAAPRARGCVGETQRVGDVHRGTGVDFQEPPG